MTTDPPPEGPGARVSITIQNLNFQYILSNDDIGRSLSRWGDIHNVHVDRSGLMEIAVVTFTDYGVALDAQRQLDGKPVSYLGADGILQVGLLQPDVSVAVQLAKLKAMFSQNMTVPTPPPPHHDPAHHPYGPPPGQEHPHALPYGKDNIKGGPDGKGGPGKNSGGKDFAINPKGKGEPVITPTRPTESSKLPPKGLPALDYKGKGTHTKESDVIDVQPPKASGSKGPSFDHSDGKGYGPGNDVEIIGITHNQRDYPKGRDGKGYDSNELDPSGFKGKGKGYGTPVVEVVELDDSLSPTTRRRRLDPSTASNHNPEGCMKKIYLSADKMHKEYHSEIALNVCGQNNAFLKHIRAKHKCEIELKGNPEISGNFYRDTPPSELPLHIDIIAPNEEKLDSAVTLCTDLLKNKLYIAYEIWLQNRNLPPVKLHQTNFNTLELPKRPPAAYDMKGKGGPHPPAGHPVYGPGKGGRSSNSAHHGDYGPQKGGPSPEQERSTPYGTGSGYGHGHYSQPGAAPDGSRAPHRPPPMQAEAVPSYGPPAGLSDAPPPNELLHSLGPKRPSMPTTGPQRPHGDHGSGKGEKGRSKGSHLDEPNPDGTTPIQKGGKLPFSMDDPDNESKGKGFREHSKDGDWYGGSGKNGKGSHEGEDGRNDDRNYDDQGRKGDHKGGESHEYGKGGSPYGKNNGKGADFLKGDPYADSKGKGYDEYVHDGKGKGYDEYGHDGKGKGYDEYGHDGKGKGYDEYAHDGKGKGYDEFGHDGKGHHDEFGKGYDEFGKGYDEFGKGHHDEFGKGTDFSSEFQKGISDSYGKGSDDFGKGPDDFGKGPDDFGKGPDGSKGEYGKGPDSSVDPLEEFRQGSERANTYGKGSDSNKGKSSHDDHDPLAEYGKGSDSNKGKSSHDDHDPLAEFAASGDRERRENGKGDDRKDRDRRDGRGDRRDGKGDRRENDRDGKGDRRGGRDRDRGKGERRDGKDKKDDRRDGKGDRKETTPRNEKGDRRDKSPSRTPGKGEKKENNRRDGKESGKGDKKEERRDGKGEKREGTTTSSGKGEKTEKRGDKRNKESRKNDWYGDDWHGDGGNWDEKPSGKRRRGDDKNWKNDNDWGEDDKWNYSGGGKGGRGRNDDKATPGSEKKGGGGKGREKRGRRERGY